MQVLMQKEFKSFYMRYKLNIDYNINIGEIIAYTAVGYSFNEFLLDFRGRTYLFTKNQTGSF